MTKKNNNKKVPKGKQLEVPGTERKTNAKVDKAAGAAKGARDAFVEASQAVQEANLDLVNVMEAEKVSEYVFEADDGTLFIAKLKGKKSVQMKKVKPTGAKDDE